MVLRYCLRVLGGFTWGDSWCPLTSRCPFSHQKPGTSVSPVVAKVNVSLVCYLWCYQLTYRAWFRLFSVTSITLPTENWHRRDLVNHHKWPLPSVLLILSERVNSNQMNKLSHGLGFWKSWVCNFFFLVVWISHWLKICDIKTLRLGASLQIVLKENIALESALMLHSQTIL